MNKFECVRKPSDVYQYALFSDGDEPDGFPIPPPDMPGTAELPDISGMTKLDGFVVGLFEKNEPWVSHECTIETIVAHSGVEHSAYTSGAIKFRRAWDGSIAADSCKKHYHTARGAVRFLQEHGAFNYICMVQLSLDTDTWTSVSAAIDGSAFIAAYS